jgi:purine-nucleoside phosphorylase
MHDAVEKLDIALAALTSRASCKPAIGIVLGSGLGAFADEVRDALRIPYGEIPHLPQSTVPGHAGTLVLGTIADVPVAVMSGRVHCYEGHSARRVAFGVRLLGLWGVKTIILTNAAGGINTAYHPGDLMVIRDHINLLGDNPLRGVNDDRLGTRFPDLSRAYTPSLRPVAKAMITAAGLTAHEGVYAAMPGPSYETPAEIEMLRRIGADAVGMSTVPEAIAAAHMRLQVVAISCITNFAAGVTKEPLSHEEVKGVADRVRQGFSSALHGLVREVGGKPRT